MVPVIMTGTFRISAGHFNIQPDNVRMTGDFAHHWNEGNHIETHRKLQQTKLQF